LDPRVLAGITFGPRNVVLGVLAVTAVFAGMALMSLRLRVIAARAGLTVTFWRALSANLVGSFFGVVTPGMIGADAVRVAYLHRRGSKQSVESVAVVLFDRVIGLYALVLLGAVSSVVAFLFEPRLRADGILLIASPVLAVLATLALALVALAYRRFGAASGPASENGGLSRSLRALGAFLQQPGSLAAAVGLSIANHILVVLVFLCAGVVLGDRVGLIAHFVADPVSMTLNAVPIAPGGLGLTEGGLSLLFERLGSLNGANVALLARVLQYVVFVVGGTIALMATPLRLSWQGRSATTGGGTSDAAA
jgi:hypothetical protein